MPKRMLTLTQQRVTGHKLLGAPLRGQNTRHTQPIGPFSANAGAYRPSGAWEDYVRSTQTPYEDATQSLPIADLGPPSVPVHTLPVVLYPPAL